MKLLRSFVAASALLAFSCTKAQGAAVVSDLTAIGRCELGYIATSPAPTPEGAVVACAGLVLADAVSTFAFLESSADPSTAAKIRAARMPSSTPPARGF
jgi:hypothetical protein